MKRKHIIILFVLVGILFFSACNHMPDFKINKDGTIPDKEIESEEYKIEQIVEEKEEPKITNATILATGDIMFHLPQIKASYDSESNTYDFSDSFKYVKKHIQSADYSVANFETVVAGEEVEYSGFPNFNSPVETLYAIKDAGFNLLTTANNHCLDQGKKGLINTIDAIEKEGMKNIGTYKTQDRSIFIEEINEIKIALDRKSVV